MTTQLPLTASNQPDLELENTTRFLKVEPQYSTSLPFFPSE